MCMSTPSAPTPPPALPEAPVAPKTEARRGAPDDQRRRAAAGQAGTSTILTSSRGITNGAQTATKTLLGQ